MMIAINLVMLTLASQITSSYTFQSAALVKKPPCFAKILLQTKHKRCLGSLLRMSPTSLEKHPNIHPLERQTLQFFRPAIKEDPALSIARLELHYRRSNLADLRRLCHTHKTIVRGSKDDVVSRLLKLNSKIDCHSSELTIIPVGQGIVQGFRALLPSVVNMFPAVSARDIGIACRFSVLQQKSVIQLRLTVDEVALL